MKINWKIDLKLLPQVVQRPASQENCEKIGEKNGLCMRSSLSDSSTEIFRGQHEPCCFITVFLPRHLFEAGVSSYLFFHPTKKGQKKWQHLRKLHVLRFFFVAKKSYNFFAHFPTLRCKVMNMFNCFLLPAEVRKPSFILERMFWNGDFTACIFNCFTLANYGNVQSCHFSRFFP